MPLSKKELTKKAQQDKAKLADLEQKAATGDADAKHELEKMQRKMKQKKK